MVIQDNTFNKMKTQDNFAHFKIRVKLIFGAKN